MSTYEIKAAADSVYESIPYWFAAFVRFKQRDTFDRSAVWNSDGNVGTSGSPVEEMDEFIVADNDIISWSVATAKSSHVSNASFLITNTDLNYAAELAPGDWVCFWAFNNKSDYTRVKAAVRNSERANNFNDGLKFMGRVDSVRRVRTKAQGGMLVDRKSVV